MIKLIITLCLSWWNGKDPFAGFEEVRCHIMRGLHYRSPVGAESGPWLTASKKMNLGPPTMMNWIYQQPEEPWKWIFPKSSLWCDCNPNWHLVAACWHLWPTNLWDNQGYFEPLHLWQFVIHQQKMNILAPDAFVFSFVSPTFSSVHYQSLKPWIFLLIFIYPYVFSY